jgi:hypothetical protein
MDEELIKAELKLSESKRKLGISEIEFAIKFAKSNGLITEGILQGILEKLK